MRRERPKEGLVAGGPYDLRLGAHRSQLRLGLIGPAGAIAAMRRFLARIGSGIPAERNNLALFPDFPGFEAVFRSALAVRSASDVTIQDRVFEAALRRPPRDAFIELVDLYGSAIDELAARELSVDVAICCLPKELRAKCATVESTLPPAQLSALRREQRHREAGQEQLFALGPGGEPATVEDAADSRPEDLLRRDFRNDEERRQPYLTPEKAKALMTTVLDAYGTASPRSANPSPSDENACARLE